MQKTRVFGKWSSFFRVWLLLVIICHFMFHALSTSLSNPSEFFWVETNGFHCSSGRQGAPKYSRRSCTGKLLVDKQSTADSDCGVGKVRSFARTSSTPCLRMSETYNLHSVYLTLSHKSEKHPLECPPVLPSHP